MFVMQVLRQPKHAPAAEKPACVNAFPESQSTHAAVESAGRFRFSSTLGELPPMRTESPPAALLFRLRRLTILLTLAAGMLLPLKSFAEPATAVTHPASLHAAAGGAAPIPGAPRASAVCMRSLRPRPINANDPHDTLAAIRGFHVTRLEWTYGNDASFIQKVHDLGVEYGGALAAGSYEGKATPWLWNVIGSEAQRLAPTWMRAWPQPNPWGCANSPEFRAGHVRAALAAVKAGADVLHRDEPGQNEHSYHWGGCFCRHCMKGFRSWLADNADRSELEKLGVSDLAAFDYGDYCRGKKAPTGDAFRLWKTDVLRTYFRQFQIDSSVAFNRWWRQELDRQVGRPIAVSCNNGAKRWTPIELAFDYCIGELRRDHATPAHLHEVMQTARSHGRTQSVTMPLDGSDEPESPGWVAVNRRTIATMYALGGHIEMPWDTYLPTTDARRYFGRPENYADLTAFIRGIAAYLDGHSEAFAGGCSVIDERWRRQPVSLPIPDGVFTTIRTRPGDAAAPLVMHVVDWRDEAGPLEVTIDRSAFFGDAAMTVRLLQPVREIVPSVHAAAFDTGDYFNLFQTTVLPVDSVGHLKLPPLLPWGVIVFEKSS